MSPDKTRKKRQRGASLTAAPRPRDADKVFYAVAEGRVTEYDYLTMLQNEFGERCSFRIDMPPLKSRRNDMTPLRVAEAALEVAKRDTNRDQYTEIWAIFDRDEHTDVTQAFATVKEHSKIKIAFSHPSFDFWLLLHFLSLDAQQHGRNGDVVNKLAARPGFAGFGADEKRITTERAAGLLPRLGSAVRNARSLADRCANGRCAHDRGRAAACGPLTQDPTTGMWRLMESLGITPPLV